MSTIWGISTSSYICIGAPAQSIRWLQLLCPDRVYWHNVVAYTGDHGDLLLSDIQNELDALYRDDPTQQVSPNIVLQVIKSRTRDAKLDGMSVSFLFGIRLATQTSLYAIEDDGNSSLVTFRSFGFAEDKITSILQDFVEQNATLEDIYCTKPLAKRLSEQLTEVIDQRVAMLEVRDLRGHMVSESSVTVMDLIEGCTEGY